MEEEDSNRQRSQKFFLKASSEKKIGEAKMNERKLLIRK